MTIDEFKAKVLSISELAGDKVEIMEPLKELQTAYEQNFIKEPEHKAVAPDGELWEKKYQDAIKAYRERFFGPAETPLTPQEIGEEAEQLNHQETNTDYGELFVKEGS